MTDFSFGQINKKNQGIDFSKLSLRGGALQRSDMKTDAQRSIFDSLDKDKNGILTQNEMNAFADAANATGVKNNGGTNVTWDEAEKYFADNASGDSALKTNEKGQVVYDTTDKNGNAIQQKLNQNDMQEFINTFANSTENGQIVSAEEQEDGSITVSYDNGNQTVIREDGSTEQTTPDDVIDNQTTVTERRSDGTVSAITQSIEGLGEQHSEYAEDGTTVIQTEGSVDVGNSTVTTHSETDMDGNSISNIEISSEEGTFRMNGKTDVSGNEEVHYEEQQADGSKSEEDVVIENGFTRRTRSAEQKADGSSVETRYDGATGSSRTSSTEVKADGTKVETEYDLTGQHPVKTVETETSGRVVTTNYSRTATQGTGIPETMDVDVYGNGTVKAHYEYVYDENGESVPRLTSRTEMKGSVSVTTTYKYNNDGTVTTQVEDPTKGTVTTQVLRNPSVSNDKMQGTLAEEVVVDNKKGITTTSRYASDGKTLTSKVTDSRQTTITETYTRGHVSQKDTYYKQQNVTITEKNNKVSVTCSDGSSHWLTPNGRGGYDIYVKCDESVQAFNARTGLNKHGTHTQNGVSYFMAGDSVSLTMAEVVDVASKHPDAFDVNQPTCLNFLINLFPVIQQ